MGFDAYRQHRQRVARRIWFAVVFVCVAVGYAAGLASSLLVGGAVTLALLVGSEIVLRRVSKAVWLKRFPELDNPYVGWQVRAWFLKSTEPPAEQSGRPGGTTATDRLAKPSQRS